MLLQGLLKYTPNEKKAKRVEALLAQVTDIAKHVNESKRREENFAHLNQVQNRLVGREVCC